MATVEPTLKPESARAEPRWRAATRIVFRFSFLYFGLYIVLTQMLTSLLFTAANDNGAFELDMTRPAQAVITWVAAHVFHAAHIVTGDTGSGDRVYDWVEVACMLALAIVGTVVWSWLDRRRGHYAALFRWFRVVVRFALGATLLTYGAVKIFPVQMAPPSFYRLLEPYGNFSRMGVLWASIGAARGYELFAGLAEFAGGALLLFPRTAVLGALIALADTVQVFTLNMTYDVPVKLFSFTLILLALIVLAPEAERLCDVILRNRPAAPSRHFRLCRGRRANRIALAVQTAAAVFLIGAGLWAASRIVMPPPPASPLNGLWRVESFTLAGQPHPPLTTDTTRWQRLIFTAPHSLVIQNMAGGFRGYNATLTPGSSTLTLTESGQPKFHADLSYRRPSAAELEVIGTFAGQPMAVTLRKVDRNSFRLLGRGFHWVQDYPVNR